MPKYFSEAELILSPNGAIYHLDLQPEEISTEIILVGDPDRVPQVSKYFDYIEIKRQHREFVTHTGYLQGKRLSVISTGISTANIDIVMNELDALVNIDLISRTEKQSFTQLTLLRLGTAGALQENIKIGSLVGTELAIDMGNLLLFYEQINTPTELTVLQKFIQHTHLSDYHIHPTISSCSTNLAKIFHDICQMGMTITCPGFYGPQDRYLRPHHHIQNLIQTMSSFSFGNQRVCNFEMETGALYGLGNLLGHRCFSISTIVGNRITGEFSQDLITDVEKMIQAVLEKITKSNI